MQVLDQEVTANWTAYRGDCCEVIKGIPDSSIDLTVCSPPFAQLYVYSDSQCDMGNCSDMEEFFVHYSYLLRELYRVTVPGRISAVHCKDLPMYLNRDGAAGLVDFPGKIIAAHEAAGWTFHSRVTIWKCPVTERERTNNHGLLHKTVCKDSSAIRQGMADYMLMFRKSGETLVSDKPIARPNGFTRYVGDPADDPRTTDSHPSPYARKAHAKLQSIDIWRRYAEPVWWDIDVTDVLNFKLGRDNGDERHICLARDSLVLTKERGLVPIQELVIGEHTLTHLGRWRPIIAKEKTSDSAKVVQVRAQGVHALTVTPTHKLWAKSAPRKVDDRKQKAAKSEPAWVESQSAGDCYLNLKLPPEEWNDTTCESWWIVGRWIADGHLNHARDTLHISVGGKKREATLERLGDRAGFTQENTASQVLVRDPDGELREIIADCGRGAKFKRFPAVAYTLPQDKAKSLLDGYLSGDGHYDAARDRWTASTSSRELAVGLQFLIQRAYGAVATIQAGRGERDCVIEGRTVHASQEWTVTFNVSGYSFGFIQDDGAWKPVKSVTEAGEAETWNIRVLEDESYTAEGCVVKNCPLQLGVIRRCVELWSNPGDVVLTPFMGVGSEAVVAVEEGRKAIGIELKESYFKVACQHLLVADAKAATKSRSLFSEEPEDANAA